MLTQRVINALEVLWTNYYDSDRKVVKPPSLDRIVRHLQQQSGESYLQLRKGVREVLKDTLRFTSVVEKDNCGISWKCYCWSQSVHLQQCLNSKLRVRDNIDAHC